MKTATREKPSSKVEHRDFRQAPKDIANSNKLEISITSDSRPATPRKDKGVISPLADLGSSPKHVVLTTYSRERSYLQSTKYKQEEGDTVKVDEGLESSDEDEVPYYQCCQYFNLITLLTENRIEVFA
jgi:hypothetical protein